jgi:uncharacterized membrane protein
VFEFLFKYRPVVFERGELALGLPAWAFLLAVLVIVVAVPSLLRYRAVRGAATRRDRIALSVMRSAILIAALFALARPVLLVSTVVPQRNFLAVLLDDSRSMRVADMDGRARADVLVELLGSGMAADTSRAPVSAGVAEVQPAADAAGASAEGAADVADSALREALEERFRVRYFAFADDAVRAGPATTLSFRGARTDMAAALERAGQELAGLPLSAFVVLTDGAHNAETSLSDRVLSLQAGGIPVYTVGLGRERIAPDLEVRRVELPRRALLGSTLVADVVLGHSGFAGRQVRLDVEDEGRIVGTRTVELPADGELPVQVQFTASEGGPRRLRFHVRPEAGEAVQGNNVRTALLEVATSRRKVLYFEGEPRFELTFLRRAVQEDETLQLVILLRTADEKFLRLNVDDPEELVGGFPRTREELFSYDGLVLGNVEASFFTHDQLQMMADFVSQRGGGLLTLGGRRALAEGGYAGTPLADALPFVLRDPTDADDAFAEVAVSLTPAGRRHPALRLAEGEEASSERWATLPAVSTANRADDLKPAAVALLNGREANGDRRVVLAHQRYGRGTVIALPIQDSWVWQMHADIPVDDLTHETLWRQLLRWLAGDSPGRLRARVSEESVNPGETLTITAEVEDERFLRVNGAAVTATVTSPTGLQMEHPMEWTVDRDGEYTLRFQTDEEGLYEVEIAVAGGAADSEAPVLEGGASGTTHFFSGPTEREQFGAAMRRGQLERLADETGGRFYTADDVEGLAEDIRYSERGNTVLETRALWDMPALFLLLLILLSAEWGYRRLRGLA